MVYNVGAIIEITVATVSLICTILTVLLIIIMKKWNGYIIMITNLSLCQAVYDISIVMYPCSDDCLTSQKFLRFSSGLAATLWTNVILSIVTYVVTKLKTIDTKRCFFVFFGIVMIPSILFAIVELFTSNLNIYYWLRIGSIIFNIIVYIFVKRQLYLMSNENNDWSLVGWMEWLCCRSKQHPKHYIMHDPVRLLAYRLKYYPIVQVISRFGVAWYEYISNSSGFDYNYDISMSVSDKVAFFLYSVTQPSAGIGFFFVFVYVSPGVYGVLIDLLFCRYGSLTKAKASDEGMDGIHQRFISESNDWNGYGELHNNNHDHDQEEGEGEERVENGGITVAVAVVGDDRQSNLSSSLPSVSRSTSMKSEEDMNLILSMRKLYHDRLIDYSKYDDEQLAEAIDAQYNLRRKVSRSVNPINPL